MANSFVVQSFNFTYFTKHSVGYLENCIKYRLYFRQNLCSLINNVVLNTTGHHARQTRQYVGYHVTWHWPIRIQSPIVSCLWKFAKLLSFLFHLGLWSPVTLDTLVPKALLPQNKSKHYMTSWSFSLVAYYLHAKHKRYEKVNSPFSKYITEVKQSSRKQVKRSLPIIPDINSLSMCI